VNTTVSLYLDLVRVLAALTIFLVHASSDRFTDGWLWRFSSLGVDAVMVFFVLSGFVIAYVVEQREKSGRDFVLARLARLWSVVVPALVLTVVLDAIGQGLDPSLYRGSHYQDSDPVWRFMANLFFIQELWFISVHPFSNSPFWSIGYEFWYYALFAVATFASGWKRGLLVFLVAAIAGPKILLLLPVWLMGIYVHRFGRRPSLSPGYSWVLFAGAPIIYLVCLRVGLRQICLDWTHEVLGTAFADGWLVYSKEFLYSYLVGALTAMNFIGFLGIARHVAPYLARGQLAIRFVAAYTFSLYLFHLPLLQFYAAIIPGESASRLLQAVIMMASLASVVALGAITELQKGRLRKRLDRLSNVFMTFRVRESRSGQ
jgi:peptidoglycan/LPS O-acetylase OafA/YrhL